MGMKTMEGDPNIKKTRVITWPVVKTIHEKRHLQAGDALARHLDPAIRKRVKEIARRVVTLFYGLGVLEMEILNSRTGKLDCSL